MKFKSLLFSAALGLSLAACGAEKGAEKSAEALANIAAPKGQEWSETVSKTADGGYVMGNPDAPLKLQEYASFSCVHCRDFAVQSKADLAKMVNSGRLSYEFNSFLLGPQDIPSSLLFACAGEQTYFPMMEAWYADWDAQMAKLRGLDEAKFGQIQALPKAQQVGAIAAAMGLTDFVAARGVSKDQAQSCLADEAAVKKLEAAREKAAEFVEGTPTIKLNGEKLEDASWSAVRNKLQEAGVR